VQPFVKLLKGDLSQIPGEVSNDKANASSQQHQELFPEKDRKEVPPVSQCSTGDAFIHDHSRLRIPTEGRNDVLSSEVNGQPESQCKSTRGRTIFL